MNAQQYFNEIKTLWAPGFYGSLTYLFLVLLSIFAPSGSLPAGTTSVLLKTPPLVLYMFCIAELCCTYSKKKEFYRIKKQNPEDDRLEELETYFLNPYLRWNLLFPWKSFQFIAKICFHELFCGKIAPGNIYYFKLDLLCQILLKICKKLKAEKKEKIDFSLLPYGVKSRFMDLQMPYMKYKLTNALKFAVFKNPVLIVDNLELHFGGHPTFYSKWFYLRYLNGNSNNKNLIIDMPWNSIKDIFEYFSTSYNDKFALTFTTKINQSENYPNFLSKIIPINSLILSSLPRDTLLSALKFSNVFSMKKLEIVQSRLSKKELNFLKTLELESILLNLGVYQSYDSIDFVLDAIQGIPDICIDITFSFFLKGYFEPRVVKWAEKYGYPKKFVFIINIFDEFHIKFL